MDRRERQEVQVHGFDLPSHVSVLREVTFRLPEEPVELRGKCPLSNKAALSFDTYN